jgi:hypothetical protein
MVIPQSTSSSSTASTPHSLALIGTSGPLTQPTDTVPPVTVITGINSTLNDKNVEMEETTTPPIDKMVEDNTDGAGGPMGPS